MHRVGPVFPGSVLCPKDWGLKPIDYSHAREFCLYLASFFVLENGAGVSIVLGGSGLARDADGAVILPDRADAIASKPAPTFSGLGAGDAVHQINQAVVINPAMLAQANFTGSAGRYPFAALLHSIFQGA